MAVGGALAAAFGGWLRLRPRRVVVKGLSMGGTLLPDDRLLVGRTHRPRPGDLVALRDPREPARLLVKRVAAVGPDGLDVRGDDPGRSTDSRAFGAVPPSAVVGVVLRRYAPQGRTGLVR